MNPSATRAAAPAAATEGQSSPGYNPSPNPNTNTNTNPNSNPNPNQVRSHLAMGASRLWSAARSAATLKGCGLCGATAVLCRQPGMPGLVLPSLVMPGLVLPYGPCRMGREASDLTMSLATPLTLPLPF